MRAFEERSEELWTGLIGAKGELRESGGDTSEVQSLIDQLANLRENESGLNGQQLMDSFYDILDSSSGAMAAMTQGQIASLETLRAEMEANRSATEEVRENTDPDNAEGMTRELYPSIIEATSSGFVESEKAREVISGGTTEQRQEAELQTQTLLLRQMVASMNDANQLTAEQLREAQKAIAAGDAERVFQVLGGTREPQPVG